MTQTELNIADMQCWIVRLAQVRWNISPAQVIDIFNTYGVFSYIADLYDLLHVSSYNRALDDIEAFLSAKGCTICTS